MQTKTIQEVKLEMLKSKENWRIPFMDFVDDFRSNRNHNAIKKPFSLNNKNVNNKNIDNKNIDALLASTIEYLCNELDIETPNWVWEVPSCKNPWFVSGYENLKAITIVESPVFFRRRKIFVLKNFLFRV